MLKYMYLRLYFGVAARQVTVKTQQAYIDKTYSGQRKYSRCLHRAYGCFSTCWLSFSLASVMFVIDKTPILVNRGTYCSAA